MARFKSDANMNFTHRFIPALESPPQRVLLLLHGTGGDENDLLPLGRELDPAAALLSPRGKILENGMPRFFRRLAEGVFDEADVIRGANVALRFEAAGHPLAPGDIAAAKEWLRDRTDTSEID